MSVERRTFEPLPDIGSGNGNGNGRAMGGARG